MSGGSSSGQSAVTPTKRRGRSSIEIRADELDAIRISAQLNAECHVRATCVDKDRLMEFSFKKPSKNRGSLALLHHASASSNSPSSVLPRSAELTLLLQSSAFSSASRYSSRLTRPSRSRVSACATICSATPGATPSLEWMSAGST